MKKKTGRPYIRRELISNPSVQYRIIFLFGFLALLYAALNYYISTYAVTAFGRDVLDLSLTHAERADVNILLDQRLRTLDAQLAVFTFLSVSMLLLGGVYLSHRIGGPLHQLDRYLEDVTEGRVPPRRIRFRKPDYFHEVARRFNAFQVKYGILKEEAAADGDPAE
ncbi:MAG: methyl-accepting chemotaxis protein [Lentisphaerae bacterium]|nr:methyl-accepting chemotaxis protein [Lentisphaerota bacterium]